MIYKQNSVKNLLFYIIFIVFSISIEAVFAEEVNNSAQQNYPPAPNLNANSQKSIQDNKIKDTRNFYKNYKSIMFNDKEIEDIFKILVRFKTVRVMSEDGETMELDHQLDEATKLIDDNNVSVYLNSILYISDNNWTIWLNGNKITNVNNGDGEIKIVRISPLRADFIWTVGLTKWDIINPNAQIPENKYIIKDNQVTLKFNLSPNQTYVPATDKIVEGKIKQEVITIINENGVPMNIETKPEPEIQNQDDLFI